LIMNFVAYPKELDKPLQNMGSGKVLEVGQNTVRMCPELLVEMAGRPNRVTAYAKPSKALVAGVQVILLRDGAGDLHAVLESDFTADKFVELGQDLKPIQKAAEEK